MIGLILIGVLLGVAAACWILVKWLIIPPRPNRPAQTVSPPNPAAPQSTAPATPPVERLPYQRIPTLLTAAERDFFAALQAAAPTGYQLFAQIRLANLVEVERWARRDKSHWWRIQAKTVDFVLCESHTFVPRLVIELDDRSHDRADRQARDAFVDQVLTAVGLPILHVRWQRRYDPGALTAQIANKLGIIQPTKESWIEPSPTQPPVTDQFWRPIATLPVKQAEPIGNVAPAFRSGPAARRPEAYQHVCGQCQTTLRENTKFCPSCGAIFAAL